MSYLRELPFTIAWSVFPPDGKKDYILVRGFTRLHDHIDEVVSGEEMRIGKDAHLPRVGRYMPGMVTPARPPTQDIKAEDIQAAEDMLAHALHKRHDKFN
jgi:hypothetical protein